MTSPGSLVGGGRNRTFRPLLCVKSTLPLSYPPAASYMFHNEQRLAIRVAFSTRLRGPQSIRHSEDGFPEQPDASDCLCTMDFERSPILLSPLAPRAAGAASP